MSKFDELLNTFEECAEARARGDESKARELRAGLPAVFAAAVVEAVAEDYRGNGGTRRMLLDDIDTVRVVIEDHAGVTGDLMRERIVRTIGEEAHASD